MKDTKLKVGDSCVIVRNSSGKEHLIHSKITKVGRLYYSTDNGEKYEIKSMCQKCDYGLPSRLFINVEEYNLNNTKREMEMRLAREFGYGGTNFTHDQLTRVEAILKE